MESCYIYLFDVRLLHNLLKNLIIILTSTFIKPDKILFNNFYIRFSKFYSFSSKLEKKRTNKFSLSS